MSYWIAQLSVIDTMYVGVSLLRQEVLQENLQKNCEVIALKGFKGGKLVKQREWILSVDVGTSSVKATIFNGEVELVHESSSNYPCLLYTSDAADEEDSVDLGGRRII